MPLTAGSLIGSYEIIAALGAGGMGEVYRARDTKLNRDVALKILPDAVATDSDRLARFRREAQVLASLNHPNIAQIHGFEDSGQTLALVMELVDGDDLSARLSHSALSLSDSLHIAGQIADALEAAHEQGIVHRDLKPANVKVREDGTVKVLDFGLAKAIDPASVGAGFSPPASGGPTMTSPAMTEMGIILGTAAYMSPEQAKGRLVDKRADIWAFGVVLYEMLTGRPLFAGDSVAETIGLVATRDPDWTTLPASTPAGVRRLLARCLTRDPKARLRDIGEARIALASPDEPAGALAPAPPLRMRLAATAAGVMVAVGAGALGWWVANQSLTDLPAPVPVHAQISTPLLESTDERPALASLAFTPDGRTLVFAGRNGTSRLLYRHQLDQGGSQPIAGTEDGVAPFVSPDGLWIGFQARGTLKKVAIGGGVAEVIHDLRKVDAVDAVAMSWGGATQAIGATWLPNGTIVYGRFAGGLWQVPAEGGPPKPVTTLDPKAGEFSHRLPHALPGGRAVVFTLQRSIMASYSIEAVDLVSGQRTHLIEDGTDARFVASGHLLFAREGALFAIRFDPVALRTEGDPVRVLPDVMHNIGGSSPARATGVAQFAMSAIGSLVVLPGGAIAREPVRIAWLYRGGRVEPLELEPKAYFAPMVSPDGRTIAVSAGAESGNSGETLYTLDVDREILTPVIKNASWPLWTPDGSRLIVKMKGPRSEMALFSLSLSGNAAPELVAESPHLLWPSSVSADGKWLAYVESNPTTGNDIWVVGLSPVVAPRVVLNTPADEGFPAVSPDGKWIAYTSRVGGPGVLYVQPFPGPGRPERVSKADGRGPVWTSGTSLFYRAGNQFMVAEIDTSGPAVRIGRTEVFAEGSFGSTTPVGGFSVAPGGKRLLVRMSDALPTPAAASAVTVQPPTLLRVIVNGWPLLKAK